MTFESDKIRILILHENAEETTAIIQEITRYHPGSDVHIAKAHQEFVRKILKVEPDIVIAAQHLDQYSGIEAYQDLRRALPFAFFVLVAGSYSEDEFRSYSLTGIDAFLQAGNYAQLGILIAQGYNKKHLEKTLFHSNRLMLERKHRLRSVFNHDQNAVFIVNYKNEILDMNPAAIELLHAKGMDTMAGMDITRFISKPDLKKMKSAHASAFRGRKNAEEIVFTSAKKNDRHAEVNFIPIKNDEGIVISVMMICKDITDTFNVNEKLKLSEDRLYTVATHAPCGLYWADAEVNFTFVNKKWMEYTGMSYQESLGKGWMKAVHPNDKVIVAKIIADNKHKNAGFSFEFRVVYYADEIRLRVNSIPIFDDLGKKLGYVGTMIDVAGNDNSANADSHAVEEIKVNK